MLFKKQWHLLNNDVLSALNTDRSIVDGSSHVDFCFISEDGQAFPCHRLVLASVSSLLYNTLVSKSEEEAFAVTLIDIPNHLIVCLLDLLYMGEISFSSAAEVGAINELFELLGISLSIAPTYDDGVYEIVAFERHPQFVKGINGGECRLSPGIIDDLAAADFPNIADDGDDYFRDMHDEDVHVDSASEFHDTDPLTVKKVRNRGRNKEEGMMTRDKEGTQNKSVPIMPVHALKQEEEEIKNEPVLEPSDSIPRKKRKMRNSKIKKALLIKHSYLFENDLRPFRCETCPKGFTTKQGQIHHTRIHTGERPYSCPECQQRFATTSDLAKHSRKHDEKPAYSCGVCDQKFRYAHSLKRHSYQHETPLDLACQECGAEFSFKDKLLSHVKKYHPTPEELCAPPEKKHICQDCGKDWKSPTELESHRRTHTGERPFGPCEKCGKRFKTRSALNTHYLVHNQERKYICDQCGKELISKPGMEAHRRKHTGEQPYQCSYCPKRFAQYGTWKWHEGNHNGNMPFRKKIDRSIRRFNCTQCSKGFFDRHELQRHLSVHSDKRPYSCRFCSASFKRRYNHIRHEKRHVLAETAVDCGGQNALPDQGVCEEVIDHIRCTQTSLSREAAILVDNYELSVPKEEIHEDLIVMPHFVSTNNAENAS